MQCDPDLLWTLVEQDSEPAGEAESIARHLECCPRCRQELSRGGVFRRNGRPLVAGHGRRATEIRRRAQWNIGCRRRLGLAAVAVR